MCAVLVSRGGDQHAEARDALRRYARSAQLPTDRVRFAHVYMDVQKQFVEALAAAGMFFHSKLFESIFKNMLDVHFFQ